MSESPVGLLWSDSVHLMVETCSNCPVDQTSSLNVSKTKELVADFCRLKHTPHTLINIQGVDIDIVDSDKYLGVYLNRKLDRSDHARALYKKGRSRLYLLRSLRSLGVQG